MMDPTDLEALERIVPDLLDGPEGSAVLARHVERYQFASPTCTSRDVLDIACGVGYGSAILHAAGARSVLGVDRSEQAIDYARARYGSPGIAFAVGDAMTFAPQSRCDAIVSLETIEHVADPRAFLSRLVRLVGVGGVVAASVPTTLSTDVNPFHLHDFSESDFRELFRSSGLRICDELVQVERTSAWSLLVRRKVGARPLRPRLLRYYSEHPVALLRRIRHTLLSGLTNRYLTLAGCVD